MAQGYFLTGRADARTPDEAVFHLFFRKLPFGGGYAVAAGLEEAVAYLRGFAFDGDDCAYLASLQGDDGRPLFQAAFLDYLRTLRLALDVDAIPEGALVFAHEPLLRVKGPLLHAQIVETALLNVINFSTLVATKAARICEAAKGKPVLEFGLRRAQGPDGALTASRAAFLGGCGATSNVLAGQRFGIPVRGTHAHSWVMSFDSEVEAFAAYGDAVPNASVFLVDTYDTLAGVEHAIEAGKRLRARGHDLGGIRLDSGDLAWLSCEARRRLDAAGFPAARIVASNDLDEHLIESLHLQGAAIDVFGVGTKLVTCADSPALGGVYKLAAVRRRGEDWKPRVKLSEQPAKTSIPGILKVLRFRDPATGRLLADAICEEATEREAVTAIVDPTDPLRRRALAPTLVAEPLLVPVLRGGEPVGSLPSLVEARARAASELAALSPSTRRLQNPHTYPVGLETRLAEKRLALVAEARLKEGGDGSGNEAAAIGADVRALGGRP
jgi:nicotinate phosphoribosyltransferase